MDVNGHTITREQYDKCTPGLFKGEFNGIGIVCLNSKVYHIWSDQVVDGEILVKTSCKGIQKKHNKPLHDDFLEMINNPKKEHFVENAGFIRDGLNTRTMYRCTDKMYR